MKYLKTILTITALVFFTGVIAQTYPNQMQKEVMMKSYQIETAEGVMDYNIVVNTKQTRRLPSEKEEETAFDKPQKITKVISIKGEDDSNFDNVLYITYRAQDDTQFNIYPTNEGFTFSVDGKEFSYRLLDRDFSIREDYENFFEVRMSE